MSCQEIKSSAQIKIGLSSIFFEAESREEKQLESDLFSTIYPANDDDTQAIIFLSYYLDELGCIKVS